jgi:hypothetical protein
MTSADELHFLEGLSCKLAVRCKALNGDVLIAQDNALGLA